MRASRSRRTASNICGSTSPPFIEEACCSASSTSTRSTTSPRRSSFCGCSSPRRGVRWAFSESPPMNTLTYITQPRGGPRLGGLALSKATRTSYLRHVLSSSPYERRRKLCARPFPEAIAGTPAPRVRRTTADGISRRHESHRPPRSCVDMDAALRIGPSV